MTTYSDLRKNGPTPAPATEKPGAPARNEQGGVAIDGVQQVIDMLRVADAAFRESILSRLAARDPELAREIRRQLFL